MSNKRALPILLALCLALCLATAAAAEVKVPALQGRVNDYARVLNSSQVADLDAELAQFERATSNQIAVLTVPSLGGEDIEGFSIRVAEAWKIGQKGRDNGVLVVVAPAEHRARIEVGYGLEGALPDAIASRILREKMTPAFRDGRFYEGLRDGVDAMMQATRGEYKAMPARTGAYGREQQSGRNIVGGIIGAIVLILLLSTRSGRWLLFYLIMSGGFGGRGGGRGDSGGGFSGGGGGFGGGGASDSW